jgi:hypothetical protein
MTDNTQREVGLLLNGEPYTCDPRCDRRPGASVRWKRRLLVSVLMIETCAALPKLAHGQFLSVVKGDALRRDSAELRNRQLPGGKDF